MFSSQISILVVAAAAVSSTTAQFSGELPRPEEYSWDLINWQVGLSHGNPTLPATSFYVFGVQGPEIAGIPAFSAHCKGSGQTGIPYTSNYTDCASETGSSVAARIIEAPTGVTRAHLAISYLFTTEEKTWNITAYVLQDWAGRSPPRNLTAVPTEVRFANSSEYRQDVDMGHKLELGPRYISLRRFRETLFGGVTDFETASEAVFEKCMGDSNPVFNEGWRGWLKDENRYGDMSWFTDISEKLAAFTKDYKPAHAHRRRPLAQPTKPIQDSTGERKLDVGFVGDPDAGKDS
ncbi:hypothetical protein DL765_010006 [Monosporascus sp. GIB2]|nr:hypothetical protein DL765_010006 [Monosporascus sp. GIB2]